MVLGAQVGVEVSRQPKVNKSRVADAERKKAMPANRSEVRTAHLNAQLVARQVLKGIQANVPKIFAAGSGGSSGLRT